MHWPNSGMTFSGCILWPNELVFIFKVSTYLSAGFNAQITLDIFTHDFEDLVKFISYIFPLCTVLFVEIWFIK